MTTSPEHRLRYRPGALAATLLVALGVLAGCSSPDSPRAGSGRPHVVASTNVYGDLARRVAGDRAEVSSVIAAPNADPHSFEASPADAATIIGASLVVYNGGGYDSFVDKALGAAPTAKVVRAVDEFRRPPGVDTAIGPDANEHVWYSIPTLVAVAEAVAARLGEIDPEGAPVYTANARTLADRLTPLTDQLSALRSRVAAPGGRPVAYAQTEPVAVHLFAAAGLADATPRGFTSAISDGADPAAADYDAMTRLVAGREIAFLAFNPQTETAVTGRLATAAESAGVPVLHFTETLPEGSDTVTWMTQNVDLVLRAATRAR